MYRIVAGLLLLSTLCLCQSFVDDAIYTVNSLKALHSVSEKFISISIDPAVLLAGLNLSDTSLELAKHLNPSYIRIAGPSTQFVKYEHDSDENQSAHLSEDTANVIVTPSMWFGINEWLTLANLTPVFGINDFQTTNKGLWNPKSTMALFELSDKLNISCHWQLGYDCSNKTNEQYREDVKILRNILNNFPDKKETWKVVASDMSACISNDHPEIIRKTLDDLQSTIAAVMWEPSETSRNHFMQDFMRPRVPVWTTAPKESRSVSFASALSWAKQLGEASRAGFEVIFRQPRLHEFFSETPAYWVSVLHKNLMGRNVLDIKSSTSSTSDLRVYGHCSKHQNNFIRSGATTILMVNNADTNRTSMLKFGASAFLKNTEVQSYILTAPEEDSTDVYLNDEKLTLEKFYGDKMNISPKLRYARTLNYLSLSLPPKSVGFFLLPGIQLPVCQSKESDLNELIEEIHQDQRISFGGGDEETSAEEIDVDSRLGLKKRPQSLKEIQQMMEKELESDEKFYKKMKVKRNFPKKKAEAEVVTVNNARDVRNFFIERAKLAEKQRKQMDTGSSHSGGGRTTTYHQQQLFELRHPPSPTSSPAPPTRELELELTSSEIKRILADRARIKAAKKNIIFTSEELEEIMNKATEKILKNKNTSITIRRKTKREADINMGLLKRKTLGSIRPDKKKWLSKYLKPSKKVSLKAEDKSRVKRDINLDLLKLKTAMLQNNNKKHVAKFENNEEKMATIREDGQTSDELFPKSVEENKKVIETTIPDHDIFAEIASSEVEQEPVAFVVSTEKPRKNTFKPLKPSLFSVPKPIVPKIDLKLPKPIKPNYEPKPKQHLSEAEEEDEDDLSEQIDNFDENDEDFACIHEYMPKTHKPNQKPKISELWEVSELPSVKEKSTNHLPELNNRNFELITGESGETGPLRNLEEFLRKHSLEDESISGDYSDIDSGSGPLRRKRTPSETESHRENQLQFLKNRLAFRKQIDLINKKQKLASSPSAKNSEAFEKLRIKYKPLSDSLKEWKPSDLLTYKPYKTRKERDVDNNINSIENEIDSFMNEITKNSEIIKPKLDVENGDYQLIFPNSDKIEVVEKGGETEVKLELHQVNATNTNFTSENNHNSNKSNIQKVLNKNKQVDDIWRQIFSKLSNFFKGLGNKLKDYVLEDLLK